MIRQLTASFSGLKLTIILWLNAFKWCNEIDHKMVKNSPCSDDEKVNCFSLN